MANEIPELMSAVLLTGHGGFETLEYRDDIQVPGIEAGEVLIKVGAAGVNNTDINTRIAWYSKSVTSDTNTGGAAGFDDADDADGSWSGEALHFPRIQGADCCGQIVAVGDGIASSRIGERVLVRTIQTTGLEGDFICRTFGSECDGGFAQYTKTYSVDALKIDCELSDVELSSFPCAYSTAEGMLERASVGSETILITGASGGVGSAAVQLAKRRGARIIAVASSTKADQVAALGADDLAEAMGSLDLGPQATDLAREIAVFGSAVDGAAQLTGRVNRGVATTHHDRAPHASDVEGRIGLQPADPLHRAEDTGPVLAGNPEPRVRAEPDTGVDALC